MGLTDLATPINPAPTSTDGILRQWHSAFWRLLWLLCALRLLHWSADHLNDFNAPWLFALTVGIALPIWMYQLEFQLFTRRAVLSAGFAESGRVVSWFWSGSLLKIWLLGKAVLYAIAILMFSALLAQAHWWVLYADVFVLVTLMHISEQRGLGIAFKSAVQGMFNRRVLYALNAVMLTVIITYLDYAHVGAVDTRGQAWSEVFFSTLTQHANMAQNPVVGWSVGALKGIDALGWHLMQVITPELHDQRLQAVAWLIFLTPSAINVALILMVLLGVSAILEHKEQRGWRFVRNPSATTFIVTCMLLAGFSHYAATKLADTDFRKLYQEANHLLTWIDPCQTADAVLVRTTVARLDQHIADGRNTAHAHIAHQVDTQIAQIFARTEQGVDAYLDWYFTISGEYERLLTVITGDALDALRHQLQQHLLEDTGFLPAVQQLDAQLRATTKAQMDDLTDHTTQLAVQTKQDHTCRLADISLTALGDLQKDALIATGALASTLLGGKRVATAVAKKAASAIISKISSGKSFQLGAKLIAKAVAKKGGSSAASALAGGVICAPGGPAAIACAGAAALVAWLFADKMFIEVDEAFHRQDMRKDMLAQLQTQKEIIKQQLIKIHQQRADHLAQQIQQAVQHDFIPAQHSVSASAKSAGEKD